LKCYKVLNNLPNEICVIENDKIIFLNSKFQDTIGKIEEMSELCDIFIDYDQYYVPSSIDWINELVDKKVKIMIISHDTFEPVAYYLQVTKTDTMYILTFSNITEVVAESNNYKKDLMTDTLTGVYNRCKFEEVSEEFYNINKRYNTNICLAMFDIDHFKKVNDTYGHDIGDETLKIFAKTIQSNIRDTDIFCRWGGEEFMLLLYEVDLETAHNILLKIHTKIQYVKIPEVGFITCSVGLVEYDGITEVSELIKKADNLLYKAKNNGRNRIEI